MTKCKKYNLIEMLCFELYNRTFYIMYYWYIYVSLVWVDVVLAFTFDGDCKTNVCRVLKER